MAATSGAFTGNMKKALAGLKRIDLEGLRWRVFDAKGQVANKSRMNPKGYGSNRWMELDSHHCPEAVAGVWWRAATVL